MQPFSVAYHFDPALRSLKESQNNSFRTSFPFAMKRTVELSHFSSFCLIPNLFFPPCCCSIQTDKNAEAAFGEGIGDWRSGIIWAFLSDVFKGTRYFFNVEFPDRRISSCQTPGCMFWHALLEWEGRSTVWRKPGCALSLCAPAAK